MIKNGRIKLYKNGNFKTNTATRVARNLRNTDGRIAESFWVAKRTH